VARQKLSQRAALAAAIVGSKAFRSSRIWIVPLSSRDLRSVRTCCVDL
jgi:hypothetical protein